VFVSLLQRGFAAKQPGRRRRPTRDGRERPMTECASSLEDRLNVEPAEAWRPVAGDVLIGELLEVRWLSGYDERPYPLLVVRRESDGRAIGLHAFHQVLRDELRAQRPRLGERLGVRYLGRVDGRYESYRLAIDRAAPAEISWEGPRAAGTEAAAPSPAPGRPPPGPSRDEPEDIPI
jgi:hypothetical protein